ncbi:hypothetical protein AAY473_033964 [Plecturocebus cupreus]
MGPAEPVRPVYSAQGSAALGHQQNSRTSQKSRAGDPCGSSAGNLLVCGQQKFVGKWSLTVTQAQSAVMGCQLTAFSTSQIQCWDYRRGPPRLDDYVSLYLNLTFWKSNSHDKSLLKLYGRERSKMADY